MMGVAQSHAPSLGLITLDIIINYLNRSVFGNRKCTLKPTQISFTATKSVMKGFSVVVNSVVLQCCGPPPCFAVSDSQVSN